MCFSLGHSFTPARSVDTIRSLYILSPQSHFRVPICLVSEYYNVLYPLIILSASSHSHLYKTGSVNYKEVKTIVRPTQKPSW